MVRKFYLQPQQPNINWWVVGLWLLTRHRCFSFMTNLAFQRHDFTKYYRLSLSSCRWGLEKKNLFKNFLRDFHSIMSTNTMNEDSNNNYNNDWVSCKKWLAQSYFYLRLCSQHRHMSSDSSSQNLIDMMAHTERPNKTAWLEILKKQTPIIKKFTEPKKSFIMFWEFFYLYKNVSPKMGKIFPKYYIAYFELCNSFDNGCLFFQNF